MKILKNKIKHYWTYFLVKMKKLLNKNSYISSKEMESIILVTLDKMYRKSEPKTSIFRLMEISPRNSDGVIEIPYDKHVIEEKDFNKIFYTICNIFYFSDYERKKFSFNIFLGASPKFTPKTQKELLIKMMEEDEKSGMYN